MLVSKSGFDKANPAHQELLERLIARRIGIFCAVGQDSEVWGERMGWVRDMANLDDGVQWSVQTSSHHKTVSDAVEFARTWDFECYPSGISNDSGAVEIIEV